MRFEFITVIVPIRNEAKHIAQVLDALLIQNYPMDHFEIIVVDGMSNDHSQKIVADYSNKHSNIHLFENRKCLSSAARNVGIKAAKGTTIVIVDGHCLIDNQKMLANINCMMQNENIHALGRPQPLFLENANLRQCAIAMARHSRLGHHPDSFIYSDLPQKVPASSVAVIYRKSVFEQIGLFDESFDACEDCELNYRFDLANLNCYFDPAIAIRYVPRSSLWRLHKQLVRYGRGRIRLAKKHPKSFRFKMFIPAIFVAGLLLGTVFSFFSSIITIAFAILYGFYTAIVVLESVRISVVRRFLPGLFLLPIVFFIIHFSSGYGELRELLCCRKKY